MPIAVIDVGTSLNDPTADNMRQAFTKCNNNFAYLDGQFLSGFVTNAQVNSYFADPSNNGSFSPSTWRTELGVYSTAQVDAYFADPSTNGSFSASTWRGDLGLGTMATQNASAVAITGGTITGITDLAIADGGTGASTAPNARTNLGLGTIATQDANNVSITGGTISGVSGTSLSGIAILAGANTFTANNNFTGGIQISGQSIGQLATIANPGGASAFIWWDDGLWVSQTASQQRSSLGLGSVATQNANAVAITGGSIAGVTGVAVIVAPPATAASTGIAGQIAYDASFIYICTATDTWLRAPIATW